MLINIIHPYTFKVKNNGLVLDKIKENEERDILISKLVNNALNYSVKVIRHKFNSEIPRDIGVNFTKISLQYDKILFSLLDERIDTVTTTKKGLPLSDKPNGTEEKILDYLTKVFTSCSELKQKIGDSKNIIFIGGFLEKCISNIMGYFHYNYKTNGMQLLYVPELCVLNDTNLVEEMETRFNDWEVKAITYLDAIEMIQNSWITTLL